MISRLNILLALVLLLSCFWLVRTSYESRRLFVELDKAQVKSHELQIEYERLEVDKQAQSASGRVQKLAQDKLRMSENVKVKVWVSTAASGAQP